MAHDAISVRMDHALGDYYKHMRINSYYNPETHLGKFLTYFIEQDYDEDGLADELGDDVDFEDCGLTEFDEDIPLQKRNLTEQEKSKEIFAILQNCYKYDTWFDPSKVRDSKPKKQPPKPASPKIHIRQTTTDFNKQLGHAEIMSWLTQVKSDNYYDLFINNGYHSLDDIMKKIQHKKTLVEMGISLRGHQSKMMGDINRLREKEQFAINKRPKDDLSDVDEEDDSKYNTPSNKPPPKLEFTGEILPNGRVHCGGDDIQKCGHMKRLLGIFKQYETWNQRQDTYKEDEKWEFLFIILDKKCNITDLMDDNHHYRDRHAFGPQIPYLKTHILKGNDCSRHHDVENHHFAQIDPKSKLSAQLLLKLRILDNIHLEWMHDSMFNHYGAPQGGTPYGGTAGGGGTTTTGGGGTTSGGTPMSPLSPPTSYAGMTPMHEDLEDEYGIPVIKQTKGNKSNFQLFQKNKIFAKHYSECSKFVSHVKLKMPSINAGGVGSVSFDEDYDPEYDPFDDEEDEQNNEDSDVFDETISSYSFGRRWYYWDHYRDGTYGKYVEKRHSNFKQEITKNNIYALPMVDWVSTNVSAKEHLRCGKARALQATGILKRYYGYEEHDSDDIKLEHIMALLFYCNNDNIQSALTQTFRIMQQDEPKKGEEQTQNKVESPWDNVRKRNSEYAIWSRLLREAVELYGIQFRENRDIKLYHGIDCELVFESINCRFCAPTSMTTQQAVATSFSRGNGLILQLAIYDLDLRFFDVQWLSNYPNESERLFVGGNGAIRINSIALSRLGDNYEHYLAAIGIIQNMFDARAINAANEDYTIPNQTTNAIKNLFLIKYKGGNKDKDEASSLSITEPRLNKLSSLPSEASVPSTYLKSGKSKEKSKTRRNVLDFKQPVVEIPSYIEQLFIRFCNKWDKQITIDITKFNESNEYRQFKKSLTETMIKEDNSYVALDFICSVFEKVQCIHIINGFKFTKRTFTDLFDLLQQHNKTIFKNLNEIKIEVTNSHANLKQITSNLTGKVQAKFFRIINWRIAYIDDAGNGYEDEDEKKEVHYEELHHKYVYLVRNQDEDHQTSGGFTAGGTAGGTAGY